MNSPVNPWLLPKRELQPGSCPGCYTWLLTHTGGDPLFSLILKLDLDVSVLGCASYKYGVYILSLHRWFLAGAFLLGIIQLAEEAGRGSFTFPVSKLDYTPESHSWAGDCISQQVTTSCGGTFRCTSAFVYPALLPPFLVTNPHTAEEPTLWDLGGYDYPSPVPTGKEKAGTLGT